LSVWINLIADLLIILYRNIGGMMSNARLEQCYIGKEYDNY